MIGRKIITLDTVDSTNNYAANLLKEGKLDHGTVIVSAIQTAGKGQRGAIWQAEPFKNLIFTCFVEYANLSVEKQEAIIHFVSLAVYDFLAENGIQAAIKWPNDMLVGSAKITGILIENQLSSSGVKSSIIGIGMNVNQDDFDGMNATSMKMCTDNAFDVPSLAVQLATKLEKYYQLLNQFSFSRLKQLYLDQLWLKDQLSDFEDSEGVFQGIIRGTDDFGRLIVEKDQSRIIYDLKEIKFIARNISGACETCN